MKRQYVLQSLPVASLEGYGEGAGRPRWHPPGGWHPNEKKIGDEFTENSGKRGWTGLVKKVWG